MRVRESTQRVGYMFVFVSQTRTQTNSLRPTRRRMRITAALVAIVQHCRVCTTTVPVRRSILTSLTQIISPRDAHHRNPRCK
jgi:hypothetical protein